MQKSWYRPLIPHAVAIGVFLIVALIYCKPLFEGKTLAQGKERAREALVSDTQLAERLRQSIRAAIEKTYYVSPCTGIGDESPDVVRVA